MSITSSSSPPDHLDQLATFSCWLLFCLLTKLYEESKKVNGCSLTGVGRPRASDGSTGKTSSDKSEGNFSPACLFTGAMIKCENGAYINEGGNAAQNHVSILPLKPITFWMRGNKREQQRN